MHDFRINTIPAAADIDYTDVDAIYGYHLLLGKICEMQGGLDCPPVNNATVREIRKQGQCWLREVKALVGSILSSPIPQVMPVIPNLGDMPELVHAYDLMYRITNGTPCYEYLRMVKLKTADRWIKGDRSISGTDVALLLLSEVDRDIRSLDSRYSDYALGVLDSWVDDLDRNGRFTDTPLSEAYTRLTYLLRTDLFVYYGDKDSQDKAKLRWVREYILPDHADLDIHTLSRYIPFIITANRKGLFQSGHVDELYCGMWSDYISRPEVHPFFRQALEMDLKVLLAEP